MRLCYDGPCYSAYRLASVQVDYLMRTVSVIEALQGALLAYLARDERTYGVGFTKEAKEAREALSMTDGVGNGKE